MTNQAKAEVREATLLSGALHLDMLAAANPTLKKRGTGVVADLLACAAYLRAEAARLTTTPVAETTFIADLSGDTPKHSVIRTITAPVADNELREAIARGKIAVPAVDGFCSILDDDLSLLLDAAEKSLEGKDHYPECDSLQPGGGYCLCSDRRASDAMRARNDASNATRHADVLNGHLNALLEELNGCDDPAHTNGTTWCSHARTSACVGLHALQGNQSIATSVAEEVARLVDAGNRLAQIAQRDGPNFCMVHGEQENWACPGCRRAYALKSWTALLSTDATPDTEEKG